MSATATATATTATATAESKAVTALKTFARTPLQTFTVCKAVHTATTNGVSVRTLSGNWEVKAAGFSSARIGQFAKAYARALSAGFELAADDTAAHNLIVRMLTAVSGSTTGIKSATLDTMIESARERGISAQTFANELAAESDAHELQKATDAQDTATDTAPTDTADTAPTADETAVRTETAVAFLTRLAANMTPDAYDAATLATIAELAATVAARAELAATVATAQAPALV